MCYCSNEDRRIGASLFMFVLFLIGFVILVFAGLLLPIVGEKLLFAQTIGPIPTPAPIPTPSEPEDWIALVLAQPDGIEYADEVLSVETVGGSHKRQLVVVWTSESLAASVTGTYGYVEVRDAAGLRGLACQGFVQNEIVSYRFTPARFLESYAYAADAGKPQKSLKVEKVHKPKPVKPKSKKWKSSDAIVWSSR